MTYQTIAYLMVAVFMLSLLYPWDLRWPAARWLAHLPLLQLPLWWRYEIAMPDEMNIRVDLLWMIPGLLLAAVVYAGKLAFLMTAENKRLRETEKPSSPEVGR